MAIKVWNAALASWEDNNGTLILRNKNGEAVNFSPGGDAKKFITSMVTRRQAFANQPSALTEFVPTGSTFFKYIIDLTGFKKFMISCNVSIGGAAAAVLGLQFSVDVGATWRGLDNGTTGVISDTTISLASTGLKTTVFVSLHADARTDTRIRIVGQNGNGVNTPEIRLFAVNFR